MTIKLSSKSGGGSSGFAVNNIVYGTIPSGSSGDILFIPSSEGVAIKLSFLNSQSNQEAGITISCGSRIVLQSGTIEGPLAAASALRQAIVIGPSLGGGSSNVLDITTLPGESLTITKDTGTTGSAIYYTHQIGV